MDAFITVDTLYLHVKYPRRDVFDRWYKPVKDTDSRVLKQGVVINDHVIKNGSSGYKISVWDHDARIFLTDEVEEKCGEGKGMGAWVQLGPKFLIQHINNLQKEVNILLGSIGIIGEFPISITRLDIAVDLLGVPIIDQDLKYWSENWVGRSKLSSINNNSRTGKLETFYFGSRKSPVYLRVYDKVAQAIYDGDFDYWFDVWNKFEGPVTRIEWEIKPKDGKFAEDLKDFSLFNGFSVRETLNYLLDWGRLCEPNPNDTNRRRWKDSGFWAELRAVVEKWSEGVYWPTSRLGKEFHGLSDAYIKFVSGTISGAMAKFNNQAPSMMDLFEGLEKNGEHLAKIKQKAEKKAAVLKRI